MTQNTYSFSRQVGVLVASETSVCFLVLFALLVLLGQTHLVAANQAAVCATGLAVTTLGVGLYRMEVRREKRRMMGRALAAAVMSLPTFFLAARIGGLPATELFSVPEQFAGLAFCALTYIGFRLGAAMVLRSSLCSRSVMVIGSSAATSWIRSAGGGAYQVQPLRLSARPPEQVRPWAVVMDPIAARDLPTETLAGFAAAGIKVMRDSAFLETFLGRIDPEMHQAGCRPPVQPLRAAAMRAFDIAFALCLLVAVLPVMLLTALAIKLEDGGPVFYRQDRVGLNGTEFPLIKFRSMRTDAEARGPVWAQQSDPRVTRIGAFIRRVRIDELPQVFNIFMGHMGVVGPRPERAHFVRQLAELIPHYEERAQVKPGLTGWAQVNYPYGASIEDARAKLSYDLYYVKHRSLLLDLWTVFATVRVVLFQEGSR